MPQAITMTTSVPSGAVLGSAFRLKMGSSLRLTDDELLELCELNRDLHIERNASGDLEIMTPANSWGGHRNALLTAALVQWSQEDGTGLAFDSSSGFRLPNGAMRAPDAAWMLRSRWEELGPEDKEHFAPLCPDFVVELRSRSDSLARLEAKMTEWIDNGARLGWLLDPESRTVHVYRPNREVEVLEDPPEVSGDPELRGFVLRLEAIWA